MLYDLFELPRDPNTKFTHFGYTDDLLYRWDSRFSGKIARDGAGEIVPESLNIDSPYIRWDKRTRVGTAIEAPAPMRVPLAKSVEFYRKSGHRLVVERLYEYTTTGLLPFRIRYREAQEAPAAVVHLSNLTTIHNTLELPPDPVGPPLAPEPTPFVTYHDPRKQFLTASLTAPVLTPLAADRADGLLKLCNDTPLAPMVARHAMAASPVQFDIEALSNYITWGALNPLRPHDQWSLENLIRNHISPELRLCDTLTGLFPEGKITYGELRGHSAPLTDIDTTPSPVLPIVVPERTYFSPHSFRTVADAFDRLSATDVKVEFTVFFGLMGEPTVHHYVDRYAHLIGDRYAADLDVCKQAALQALLSSSFIFGPESDDPLGWAQHQLFATPETDTMSLVLEKTHNDEALISFYRGGVLDCAIHLDLAMLSLCSLGIIETLDDHHQGVL